jgi:hypothetical protein
MDRADLHRLVDTLPEGAFENAIRILEHFQVWPPQPPPEMERMTAIRQEQMQRMRRSMRPGTGGGGGGGGIVRSGGYGHSSHSRIEDGAAVMESYHFYKGHEIAVIQRLRCTDDNKAIHYTHEVRGPKGDTHLSEMTFDVD